VQTLGDLEELAWLESSRTPLPLEPRAPADLAADAARRAAPVAEHGGVALVVEAGGAPPLRCDPGRLEQVLDALLRRALRSSERGATVTLRATATGEGIRFTVEGGQPGEEARAHLEQDLWSFRAARGAPELLALALSRAIVSAHGGRITLDPAAPLVHVDLPLSPLVAAPAPAGRGVTGP
jgi:signal transduction histidine kinase